METEYSVKDKFGRVIHTSGKKRMGGGEVHCYKVHSLQDSSNNIAGSDKLR